MKVAFVKVVMIFAIGMTAQASEGEGWQFNSFEGEYSVVGTGGCPLLSGTVSVGHRYSRNYLTIAIQPRFSSVQRLIEHLTPRESRGEDCYECDPDWWEIASIGGDGVRNATFRKSGTLPYTHVAYSIDIELVRVDQNRVAIKVDECAAELVRR